MSSFFETFWTALAGLTRKLNNNPEYLVHPVKNKTLIQE